ncbi:hypothetical protein P355_1698 [Burkholderia cenocepacia KC-01]|nr:hypothetical protein P355_1698 [Burkholderia cenocepacia KC-01]
MHEFRAYALKIEVCARKLAAAVACPGGSRRDGARLAGTPP